MAGRFLSEYARTGAVNAPAGLIDLGKKLLGQLEEQRRLGGPITSVIRGATSEGSVVAQMVHGHPRVQYQVNTPTTSAKIPVLAGFVLSPTATSTDPHAPTFPDNGTNPEVLALVNGKTSTTYPSGGFSRYRRWFPRGIRQAGNIDWRDAKEQWVISYYGPRNRYFEKDWAPGTAKYGDPGQGGFQPWIIRNGWTLIDLSNAALLAAVPALSGCRIVGAGIFKGKLIFVARNSSETAEFVYSVSLPGKPTTAKIFASVASLTLLTTRATLTDENTGEASHPWLFNQSGNEARCIRQAAPGFGDWKFYEGVLTLSDFTGVLTASFAMNLIGTANVQTTTNNASGTGSTTKQTQWLGGTTSPLSPLLPATAWGSNGHITNTNSVVKTNSVPLQKIAVDYANNVPVYAYARAPDSSQTISDDLVVTFSESAGAYATSTAETYGSTTTGQNNGVKTDDVDITTSASETVASSISGAVSIALGTQASQIDNYFCYTGGTFSKTVSNTVTSDQSNLSVSYMDLRQGWLVYELVRTVQAQTDSASVALTLTGYIADTGKTFSTASTNDTTTTTTTRVLKRGVVLFEDVVTYSSSAPSTTVSPLFYPDSGTGTPYRNVIGPGSVVIGTLANFNIRTGSGSVDPQAAGSTVISGGTGRLTNWFCDTLSDASLNSGIRSQRVDQNVFRLSGSWTEYQNHWAFSMGLPRGTGWRLTTAIPDDADRWANGIQGGDLPTIVAGKSEHWVSGANPSPVPIVPPPFDLFFPISVLPVTAPIA